MLNQGNCNTILAKESMFASKVPVTGEKVKAFYWLNYLENYFRLPEPQLWLPIACNPYGSPQIQ